MVSSTENSPADDDDAARCAKVEEEGKREKPQPRWAATMVASYHGADVDGHVNVAHEHVAHGSLVCRAATVHLTRVDTETRTLPRFSDGLR